MQSVETQNEDRAGAPSDQKEDSPKYPEINGRPDPRSFGSRKEAKEYLSGCSEVDRYFFWVEAFKRGTEEQFLVLLKALVDEMEFDPVHDPLPKLDPSSSFDLPALYFCILGSWEKVVKNSVRERIFPLGNPDFKRIHRTLHILNGGLAVMPGAQGSIGQKKESN